MSTILRLCDSTYWSMWLFKRLPTVNNWELRLRYQIEEQRHLLPTPLDAIVNTN